MAQESYVVRYLWNVKDEWGNLLRWGIDEGVDLLVCKVIGDENNCCDRNIWDMQKYLDKNYPELKLKFKYIDFNVYFADLRVENT